MMPSISADDVVEQLPWLRAFAARLASPADVDDLVSQTWIAAWEEGARVEVDARGPRPWLGAVLRNKARMLHRGRVRREDREAKATDAVSQRVEQDLTRLSVLAEVVAAIRRLPEEDQAMVVQRYCEGRTSAEIGEALGLKPASVRSRLKRSLATLRDELDERHHGERAAWAGALGVGLPSAESGAAAVLWGVGLTVALAAVATAVIVASASGEESAAEQADEDAPAALVSAADSHTKRTSAHAAWEARKKRVLAANDAFVPGSGAAPDTAGVEDIAQLAGSFAALQQGVFDDCVADLSLDRDTAFVVRSQVVGAPGVGTIVAEVEIDDGATGTDALLECVREGMYVLEGAAPAEPFEAEMSFGLGDPEASAAAVPLDETPATDATPAQQTSVQTQAAGAAKCVGEATGSAVLLLSIGDDGAVSQVRFEETTLSLEVVDCVADHALANWTLDATAGSRLRAAVRFPGPQASR